MEEATSSEAVVWIALQGGAAAGPLQRWLEQWRVPFVGAPVISRMCSPVHTKDRSNVVLPHP